MTSHPYHSLYRMLSTTCSLSDIVASGDSIRVRSGGIPENWPSKVQRLDRALHVWRVSSHGHGNSVLLETR